MGWRHDEKTARKLLESDPPAAINLIDRAREGAVTDFVDQVNADSSAIATTAPMDWSGSAGGGVNTDGEGLGELVTANVVVTRRSSTWTDRPWAKTWWAQVPRSVPPLPAVRGTA